MIENRGGMSSGEEEEEEGREPREREAGPMPGGPFSATIRQRGIHGNIEHVHRFGNF